MRRDWRPLTSRKSWAMAGCASSDEGRCSVLVICSSVLPRAPAEVIASARRDAEWRQEQIAGLLAEPRVQVEGELGIAAHKGGGVEPRPGGGDGRLNGQARGDNGGDQANQADDETAHVPSSEPHARPRRAKAFSRYHRQMQTTSWRWYALTQEIIHKWVTA